MQKNIEHYRRIKLFLGGFINSTNAQNLNCLALCRHLNKQKFDCFSLELYSGNLPSQKNKIEGLKLFRCFYPAKLSIYLGFLWGIWKCDVAYLPKGEVWRWNRFWLKLLNKKSFSTIEGVMDAIALQNAFEMMGSKEGYLKSRKYLDKDFSITNYLKKYNLEYIGLSSEEQVLYLGVDSDLFKVDNRKVETIKILLIGNDLIRKGVFDYLDIAREFPQLTFYVAGSGNGKIDMNVEIIKRNLNNVEYAGSVTTEQFIKLLNEVNLHILPSRSEGFPKVILETAAAGVPTIAYSDYGAFEWITQAKNGWVVDTKEEMISTIKELIADIGLLEKVAIGAKELSRSFDWKIRVKDWENVISTLSNENGK